MSRKVNNHIVILCTVSNGAWHLMQGYRRRLCHLQSITKTGYSAVKRTPYKVKKYHQSMHTDDTVHVDTGLDIIHNN